MYIYTVGDWEVGTTYPCGEDLNSSMGQKWKCKRKKAKNKKQKKNRETCSYHVIDVRKGFVRGHKMGVGGIESAQL